MTLKWCSHPRRRLRWDPPMQWTPVLVAKLIRNHHSSPTNQVQCWHQPLMQIQPQKKTQTVTWLLFSEKLPRWNSKEKKQRKLNSSKDLTRRTWRHSFSGRSLTPWRLKLSKPLWLPWIKRKMKTPIKASSQLDNIAKTIAASSRLGNNLTSQIRLPRQLRSVQVQHVG